MSTPTTSSVADDLEIALPPHTDSFSQDEEWCVVYWKGVWQKVLIHDYETIFSIPGFYEKLVYDILDCRSPVTVCRLLDQEISGEGVSPGDLHVLDFGAGNGMVGEELKKMGARSVVGVDIIPEARTAADRDRPGVYADYKVLDMTDISPSDLESFRGHRLNCLVTVAALGFGDIPPRAFTNAFNLVKPGGWIAFNIKEEFLGKADDTGFSGLVRRLESAGALEIQNKLRYQHRLGTDRKPIPYFAVVGRKRSHAPVGIANGSVS